MSLTIANDSDSGDGSESRLESVKNCKHCGTLFSASSVVNEDFCCSGCAFVFSLIFEGGFDQFYDLKGGETIRPVQNIAFDKRDYEWLQAAMREAESFGAGVSALTLGLDGASCSGCVWLIEKLFSQHAGALRVFPDVVNGRIEVTWETGLFDLIEFAHQLQQHGYLLGAVEVKRGERIHDALLGRVGLCAAFALNGMAFTLPRYLGMPGDFMFAKLFALIGALSATLALGVGGSYFIKRAWAALGNGVIHIDVPIALGMVLAYLGSTIGWLLDLEELVYFDFVAIFVFLMLGGRWLQEEAIRRNRRQLTSRDEMPREVLSDGNPVTLSEIRSGLEYLVKPGHVIPVASRLLSDWASIGMEWIQGESETLKIEKGAIIGSGAVHRGLEPLLVEARESWQDSLLYRLTEAKVGERRYPYLERILRVYLWVVISLSFLGGLSWWVTSGQVEMGLQVAISILVISCPCALGVAIPLADEFALASARKLGVFVQQVTFWGRLRRVRKVLFDKTGTLTLDVPRLLNAEVIGELSGDAQRALGKLVARSSHPLSRSLAQALIMFGHSLRESGLDGDVVEVPGEGVHFVAEDGRLFRLVKPSGSVGDVEFWRDGELLSSFRFQDFLRPGARGALRQLIESGLDCYIMSGDREAKVAAIAEDLELARDHWRAEMTPDEKAEWVGCLDAQDTLYVGDGANDSLAFDRAYATMTPAFDKALLTDKADCYFVGQGFTFLSPLQKIAHQRHEAVMGVFVFAAVYNVFAVAICLTGRMNPLLAAVLMPISSVVTTTMVAFCFREIQRKGGVLTLRLKQTHGRSVLPELERRSVIGPRT